MDIKEVIARADAFQAAGEDGEAEKLLLEANEKYTEEAPDDVVGQSVLLNELGGFYRNRGFFGKGEEAYLRAKDLLEEIRGHAYTVDGPAPAPCCCACGGYVREEAQRHTEIVYTNERMTENYATTLNNLAGLYRMSGQLQKAADMFDAAIKIYEDCGERVSPDHLASGYNNKGLVYLDMQDADKARAMFLTAKAILERGGDYRFAFGTTISNLGFAAILEKKFSEAKERFQEAKALFEESGSSEMARNCEEMLSRLEAGK